MRIAIFVRKLNGLAEKEHVRSEILKSNGNTNSIWKILNRYIPRKNTPLAAVENPSKQIQ